MGKIYERRKTDHENHETEQNCFRNKGTRKQIAETPKLTPMDTSTSLVSDRHRGDVGFAGNVAGADGCDARFPLQPQARRAIDDLG